MNLRLQLVRLALTHPETRAALVPFLRRAETTPLPGSFPGTEIGLQTKEEFLAARNPGGKHHPSDSYDFSFAHMNQNYALQHVSTLDGFDYYASKGSYIVKKDNETVAVNHKGVLYYRDPSIIRKFSLGYWERGTRKRIDFDIKREQQVKYLYEVVAVVNDVVAKNLAANSHILQRIKVQGKFYEVRSGQPPRPNRRDDIVIMNDEGLIVAAGSDEWGATLLVVSQEHRGLGLGKILGKFWYLYNPASTSGGFTEAGQRNAEALWEDRVREFLKRGWYSALIRQKRLTKARVDAILAGIGERHQPRKKPAPKNPKKQVLVYVDYPSFVVYDQAFLEAEMTEEFRYEEGAKLIYGYGFFRDSPPVGNFLFTIDYERAYDKLVTTIALQMARDEGEPIYVGPGYGDMLEYEKIPDTQQEGDYVSLTKDALPLRSLGSKEQTIRRKTDRYGQRLSTLLEMAESKWS